jgi:hypothetical protein
MKGEGIKMKHTFYFVNDNGHLRIFETDNANEIEHARIQFGNVFSTKADALADIKKPKKIKVRALTPKEEKEQYLWGLSQMTEEEKAWVREERKTVDQLQLEYATEQMRLDKIKS